MEIIQPNRNSTINTNIKPNSRNSIISNQKLIQYEKEFSDKSNETFKKICDLESKYFDKPRLSEKYKFGIS